jgi:hypothetical protein
MKRWVVLSVFCFVLLLGSVTADETVYSGDIGDEQSVEIDGITYTAYGYADYTGLRLSSNAYGSLIIESIGESLTAGVYTYTLSNIYEGSDNIYFTVTVSKEGGSGSVSISRSGSSYNPVLGEVVDVTITIENGGSGNVKVRYEEDLPSEVSLSGSPEVTVGTTTQNQQGGFSDVYYKGVLYGGEELTITYSVYVDSYPSDGSGVITFDGVDFTYEDTSGSYQGSLTPFKFTLGEPVVASIIFEGDEETKAAIGDERTYTLAIDNQIDSDVHVSNFLFSPSSGFKIVESSITLEETSEGLSWNGKLEALQSTDFYVILRIVGAGVHTSNLDATYWYEDESETYTVSDSEKLTIGVTKVVPKIALNSGATYEGGEDIIIQYTINNSDASVSYSGEDVTLSTTSNFFDSLYYSISIPAASIYLIKKQNFTAPFSDKELSYSVTMEGSYVGIPYSKSETFTIFASTFTVPYAVEYTVDGIDEIYTNVTMNVVLLSTLVDMPTKFAVIHTTNDYKKTLSLTTDQIATLFSTGEVTKSWSINTLAYPGDTLELQTQLQYDAGTTYYKSGIISLPIYKKVAEEPIDVPVDANVTTATNVTVEEPVEVEEKIVITGEKENAFKKWVFFILVLLTIGMIALSLRYFVQKKQKEMARKKRIEEISGQETTITQKESFFQKAKEIVIHDVPTPEEGYEKLHMYLQHMIVQGKNNEEIKKVLVAKGWLEEVLDSYLGRLR